MSDFETKKGSPYRAFMWGALLASAVCFGLAAERLRDKRPARADIYTIAGILGLLSVAAAWSQGSAHERSRRSQESLQGSLERLQDRMADLPRALMSDSVKVAEQDRRDRRVDQEQQAGELHHALEEGLRAGFAPLAPALSQHIVSSLASLSVSLRADREERVQGLREMAETLSGLQASQKLWAQSSSILLEKLGEQGKALQSAISDRDNSWRGVMEKLSGESASRFQALAETFLTKMDSSQRAQHDLLAAELRNIHSEAGTHFEKTAETLSQGLRNLRESVATVSADASERIRASAAEAGAWLKSLSQAAEMMQAAAQEARSMGQISVTSQQAFGSAVESLNQSLTGMLDRVQSLAALAQGQEALLAKMESTVRSFEERSVELLEENALRLQETFLDALVKVDGEAGARGA